MAAVASANLLFGDLSRLTAMMWLYLVIGSVLVEFNEELISRGQLLVAPRSRFGEAGVRFLLFTRGAARGTLGKCERVRCMKGRISLSSPRATAVAAAVVGAALFVAGVVLNGAAAVSSAAEYNANEATGNVDLGPSAGVIWLSWIAIAAGVVGASMLLAVLVLNLTIALRRSGSRTPEPVGR